MKGATGSKNSRCSLVIAKDLALRSHPFQPLHNILQYAKATFSNYERRPDLGRRQTKDVSFHRFDDSGNGAKVTLLRELLNTWFWACVLLVRGSKILQKRENLIFSVEQMSVDYINNLPCLIELQFIYLGGRQNCWIENSSPEVSFSSLSSMKHFPIYVPKLIISRSPVLQGFAGGSDSKESTSNVGDLGFIPGLGRSPGGGHGHPLQCSCLENPMDRRAQWATVHGVAKKELDTTEQISTHLFCQEEGKAYWLFFTASPCHGAVGEVIH